MRRRCVSLENASPMNVIKLEQIRTISSINMFLANAIQIISVLDDLNPMQDHDAMCCHVTAKQSDWGCYPARAIYLEEAPFRKYMKLLKTVVMIPAPIATSAELKM